MLSYLVTGFPTLKTPIITTSHVYHCGGYIISHNLLFTPRLRGQADLRNSARKGGGGGEGWGAP